MLTIKPTSRFLKDLKKAAKRGNSIHKLEAIIDTIQSGQPLAPKHRDHFLVGNWTTCRECHIGPDWLLIYKIEGNDLILLRTGSHSDLF